LGTLDEDKKTKKQKNKKQKNPQNTVQYVGNTIRKQTQMT
jgi:hypothetical protein